MYERIIVLVDMDCFYCQVETRLNPNLKGKPVAVVQYNEWQGGGIIAVSYEARALGVTRFVRGNEARKICPDINLVHVPSIRGKADLTRYRDAGREVVDVLCRFCDTVQRASVDEAYLDITQEVDSRWKDLKGKKVKLDQLPNTFVVGFSAEGSNDEEERREGLSTWLEGVYQSELQDDRSERLVVAALIIEEVRDEVFKSTGFRCSAGIAHNKILAKLACGLHKPQRQTLLPPSGVPVLYRTLPIKKIKGLGGKFGELVVQKLGITFMGDLEQYNESYLQKVFDAKSGRWLFNLARGIDDEPVTARLKSKSIGCCKKFPGKLALRTKETVEHWLGELAAEVMERLDQEMLGGRRATQMIVSFMQTVNGQDVSSSRCGPLTSYSLQQLITDSLELMKRSNAAPSGSPLWVPPLKFLGLSVGKFIEKEGKIKTIDNFFKASAKRKVTSDLEVMKPEEEISEDIKDIKEMFVNHESYVTSEDHETNGTIEDREANCTPTDHETNCEFEEYTANDMLDDHNVVSCRLPSERSMRSAGKSSASKRSFFMNFFKQEGLVKTPRSKKKILLTPKHESKHSGISQTASTSGIQNLKPLKENLSLSESSNDFKDTPDLWVSPREIFPDLDNVDEAVAALLPSPLQRKLQTRVEKHQKAKEELNSLQKNKGQGKGKSKKALTYNISGMTKEEVTMIDERSEIFEEPLVIPNDCDLADEESAEAEPQSNCVSQDIFASNSPLEHMQSSTVHIDTMRDEADTDISVSDLRDRAYGIESCEPENNICFQANNENIMQQNEDKNNLFSESSRGNIKMDEVIREECVHCKLLIPLQDYPEHLDFHVATDLDQKLNRNGNQPQVSYGSRDVSTSGISPKKDFGKRKRGRPNGKQPTPVNDKKLRSIATFFARAQ